MSVVLRFTRDNKTLECSKVVFDVPTLGEYDSMVDKSKFRPNVDEVHLFDGGSDREPLYDFSDGIDTGLRVTQLRSKSSDITELKKAEATLKASVKAQEKYLKDEVDNAVKEMETVSTNNQVSNDSAVGSN